MQAFSELLDALSSTRSTLAKRRLMAEFFVTRPDPERGWALAALTDTLSFPAAKPALVRDLVKDHVDPVLFALSRDYVGDMAETVALIWPEQQSGEPPSLEQVIEVLSGADKKHLRERIMHWLNTLDTNGRWALLKLITGHIRIGVSARLAKTALSDAFHKDLEEIEELWPVVEAPFTALFAWAEDKACKPEITHRARFMPMMLSHPIEDDELASLPLADYQIELKWDGIRMQLVRTGQSIALYSRTGDDITRTFPDIAQAALALPEQEFVLDGELLTTQEDEIAPFNSLQQRLNRRQVSAAMLKQFPAHVRLYDILVDNGQDVRAEPLSDRRIRLEQWLTRNAPQRMDISSIIAATEYDALAKLRLDARDAPQNGVEGLMVKKRSSPYIAGRPRGHWFKWKRNTLTLDCVLLYAQRGSGKRSSFYSDYTFGLWENGALLPVGKAYSGFTDEELVKIDKWVRANTTERFGPVRQVSQGLVMEIEFDSLHTSARHKSGVAMRFPRVHRIRWDKPVNEADTLETARKMIIN